MKNQSFGVWRGKTRQGMQAAFTVDLTFDEPVAGPIALGYASHFGFGIFMRESCQTGEESLLQDEPFELRCQ